MVVVISETSTRDDLQGWADAYGSTHAVAGDYERWVWSEYAISVGRPQYLVIDRDFRIVHAGRNAADAEAEALELL